MTTDLEKQFFSTFRIEPKEQEIFVLKRMIVKEYPQITDHILLELICILNTRPVYASNAHGTNVYDLKNYVLKRCIYEVDNIKPQVRTLFEEG